MPKFARSNAYSGSHASQKQTGQSRFATSAEAAAGVADELAISPATLDAAVATLMPDASTTVKGKIQLATSAESVTGSNSLKAVVPSGLTARLAAPGTIGGTTPGAATFTTLASTGASNIGSGAGVSAQLGNATGTLGFFGSVGATKVTQEAITNSVTAGGVTGTIADYTDLSVYANDAAAIRNDIYQLSLALANVVGALRSYGLLV